jgi:hypothetical protein
MRLMWSPLLVSLAPFLFLQVMDQIDPPSGQRFTCEIVICDA